MINVNGYLEVILFMYIMIIYIFYTPRENVSWIYGEMTTKATSDVFCNNNVFTTKFA